MITIEIKQDNYAYIKCDNISVFQILLKLFTKTEKKYNQWSKKYIGSNKRLYTVVNPGKEIKVPFGLTTFLCYFLDDQKVHYTLQDDRSHLENIMNIETKLNKDIQLRDYQIDAVKEVFKNSFGILQLPTGTGKEQPITAKVLTPNGFINIGDIKIGDCVIAGDGYPTAVIGVYPQGIKDVYRLTFNDNTYAECGLNHIWTVSDFEDQENPKYYNITLKEILKYQKLNNVYNKKNWLFEIPITSVKDITLEKRKQILYNFVGYEETTDCKSYLRYYAKSKRIKNDLVDLAQSLGYIATCKIQYRLNKETDKWQKEYKIEICIKNPKRYIKKIEYKRKEESVCIEVLSKTKQYLTNSYIVTHNTEIASSIIKTYFTAYNNSILYVVPTLLLQNESCDRFKNYNIKVNDKLPIKDNVVNVLTYQSLVRSIDKKLSDSDRNKIDMIIFDECHHLQGIETSKITHKFNNVKSIIGLTATPSKVLYEKKYLYELSYKESIMYGSVGPIIYKYKILDSINNKFVTPIKVNIVKYNNDVIVKGNNWLDIKNKILKSEERAEFVSSFVYNLISENSDLKTICLLIPEIEWSRLYMQKVADTIANKKIEIYELHGNNVIYKYINKKPVKITDKEVKRIIYNNIQDENKITIFSCTSFFFEGANIKNLQAIINCYGGRDSKRVKQQTGRVMRLFENKDVAMIYEIQDLNNHILQSQLIERLKIYKYEYGAEIQYLN